MNDNPKASFSGLSPRAGAVLLGALTAVSGLSIIWYVMGNAEIFAPQVVRVAQFSPLWLAGIIGWVIASTPLGSEKGIRSAILLAVFLAVPVALVDPWALVALRMGGEVSIVIKGLLLSMPVVLAAVFAYPARGALVTRRAYDVLIMLSATAGSYYLIYEVLLRV